MARQGIREATLDYSGIRLVLTGFATQLGQLRALAEMSPTDRAQPDGQTVASVTAINKAITSAMEGATKQMPQGAPPSGRRARSTNNGATG